MKLKDVVIGMKVAVNANPDGMVYTVTGLDKFEALMTYPSSRGDLHTSIDVSVLRKPTAAQLANAAKS